MHLRDKKVDNGIKTAGCSRKRFVHVPHGSYCSLVALAEFDPLDSFVDNNVAATVRSAVTDCSSTDGRQLKVGLGTV